MERVVADNGALRKHGLNQGGYWFAMSSLAPNKNLRWLVETALLNPGETIAIAGGINTKIFGEHDIPQADNVRYLGYVSDEEAKALMGGCKGFLFPTFYEGFGIPPMEAMAAGVRRIVASDIPCMHEIYGDSVSFINPIAPYQGIDELKAKPAEVCKEVLNGFDWRASATRLFEILAGCLNCQLNNRGAKKC